MKNTHELPGPAEVSHDDRARAADPLPGVKEDQMMGPEVFSATGFAAGTFSKRMGKREVVPQMLRLVSLP